MEEVSRRLEESLTKIFNDDGKRTVLFYLSTKYGLTLEEASADPARLERSLTNLLGEVGWMVVKRAILETIWERKVPRNDVVALERTQLREVFGSVKSMLFFPALSFSR